MPTFKTLDLASLIIKVVVMLFIFIVICCGAFGIFASDVHRSLQQQKDAGMQVAVLDMEYSFLALSVISFLFCLISSILNCCGFAAQGNKALNFGDIALCILSALILFTAGAVLIAAAETYCDLEKFKQGIQYGVDLGGGYGGGYRGRSGRGRLFGIGIGSCDPSDSQEDCYVRTCKATVLWTPKIIAGSFAIISSLVLVAPILLALKAAVTKDPNTANGMEWQEQGAYGGNGGVPGYPMYVAPPPQYYQPQDGSYGGMQPQDGSSPQMSPSQVVSVAAPPQGGQQ